MKLDTEKKRVHTSDYLKLIGIKDIPPTSCVFDPGYDLVTLRSHLEQSYHLIEALKISMACWMIAQETISRKKVIAAKKYGIPTITGGGPFEIAVVSNKLSEYLDLVADFGFERIECGEGFTNITTNPRKIIRMANDRGLEVQFELGKKKEGQFTKNSLQEVFQKGEKWVDAGAVQLIIEGRESAVDVGLFDGKGNLNAKFADLLIRKFGHEIIVFEAPNKKSQFSLLNHFGSRVHLSNIRLEELLRVEIYRRGLHSDSFGKKLLRLEHEH